MTTLPPGFVFSQSSLQDYHDCQRRFQLRYIEQLAWPAVEMEPILQKEQWMKLGARFHRLIHQHLLGLDVETLAASDPHLAQWWQAFQASGLAGLPAERYPEKLLSVSLAGASLVAKYDLVALDAQRAVIVDWKTMRRRPPERRLTEGLQTRVYRYVLARAGALLNHGQPIPVASIQMRYWFAAFPDAPLTLSYSDAQFAEDEAVLRDLITGIQAATEFPQTPDEQRCRFCQYRSLCARGARAGSLEEAEALYGADLEGPAVTLDLEF